jgi:uncharacterized protein (DUF736 family)
MTVSIPVLKLVCNDCGEQFDVNPGHFAQMGFKNLPKRCPKCADTAQQRPSVVVERKLLNVYDGVKIVSLPPGEWREVKGWKKDIPAFRLTWKGSEYGASWSGRIDLFAPTLPQIGDVVSIREMESRHLVKVRREQKQTMEHGEVIVEKELPITADDPEAEEVIRTRRYLVLEPFDGEATCQLVWAEAHTKTTLKGLGRQYWARVEGAPIASWYVFGGVRSGRAHTTGVLAIVDQERPLYIIKTGDIEGEEIYGGMNE